MPLLKEISLVQFKNYGQERFGFEQRITGISGANGAGKTNLLDAIYYLCFTKSYFAATDGSLVQKGCKGFRLTGIFEDETLQPHTIAAVLREHGKKEISWDGEIYPKVSGHIGRLPAVVIAPDDVEIITGGSDGRRKMADAMLCQMDENYLQNLMAYNKILQQRNVLLKQMAENPGRATQHSLLDVLDSQLAARGAAVTAVRSVVLPAFLQKVAAHYAQIAGSLDSIHLTYLSSPQTSLSEVQPPENAFLQVLQQQRARDLAMQRTSAGPHRDDLLFEMMGQPFKQTASQGQRKSLLFALKLTEFEWLEKNKGFAPILLLDDVFEKLDEQRMQNLLQEVCLQKKGQVFITDTHPERLHQSLQTIGVNAGSIRL